MVTECCWSATTFRWCCWFKCCERSNLNFHFVIDDHHEVGVVFFYRCGKRLLISSHILYNALIVTVDIDGPAFCKLLLLRSQQPRQNSEIFSSNLLCQMICRSRIHVINVVCRNRWIVGRKVLFGWESAVRSSSGSSLERKPTWQLEREEEASCCSCNSRCCNRPRWSSRINRVPNPPNRTSKPASFRCLKIRTSSKCSKCNKCSRCNLNKTRLGVSAVELVNCWPL